MVSRTHRIPGRSLLTLLTQAQNQDEVVEDPGLPLAPGLGAEENLRSLFVGPLIACSHGFRDNPGLFFILSVPSCPDFPSSVPFWASHQRCQVSAPVFPTWRPAQLPGDILSLWPRA